MSQMKGQDEPLEKTKWSGDRQLSRKRIQNIYSKMIQDLGKTMEKMQEMFAENIFTRTTRTKELWLELQELKHQQPEMNNTLEGINNKITEVEERISDLKDGMVEITAIEQNIEKKNEKKWRQPKRPLGQHQMQQHLHYRGLRSRREREKGPEKIFEGIIAENFPNKGKEIVK